MISRTYIIIISLLLGITVISLTWFGVIKYKAYRQTVRTASARNAVAERRAAESNAVVAKVEARRAVPEIATAKIIELGTHINCSLNTSFVPKNVSDNNLVELGESTQTLAG